MATLYIIGNGFDKQHGLKTSYWDFRCYSRERIFSHQNHCSFQSIVVSLRQEVIETYKDEKMQKRLWKEGSFEQGI